MSTNGAVVDMEPERCRQSERLSTWNAIDVDNDLTFVTDRLATRTRAQTNDLIVQNRRSYVGSRNLFIGVGGASILSMNVVSGALKYRYSANPPLKGARAPPSLPATRFRQRR